MVQVARQVWVPNMVTRQVPVTVNQSQLVSEPYTYTVTSCRNETRVAKDIVTDYVPETKTRDVSYTVCVPQTRKVTVNQQQMVPEKYTYNVTSCKNETRVAKDIVTDYVPETKTRDVSYTVCNAVNKSENYNVTEMQCVTEQQVVTDNVTVPVCVQKLIEVNVCRMVPTTVTRMVPCGAAAPAANCAPCAAGQISP